MKRKTFLQSLLLLSGIPGFLRAGGNGLKSPTSIRLLRHATLIIEINQKKILVDPMLAPKDSMGPIQNSGNQIRIPMVELPVQEAELRSLLLEVDAVALTHLHGDHWDMAAQKAIAKDKPVFCQPNDADRIRAQGFSNVLPIPSLLEWNGVTISRTGGMHGTGEIGKRMGEVSGFVFASGTESVYVAGDTIWCDEVDRAIAAHNPSVTILNAGGARFLTGDPITMTPGDIIALHHKHSQTRIVAVHMDTINHCVVNRSDLLEAMKENGLADKVWIPQDGETIRW